MTVFKPLKNQSMRGMRHWATRPSYHFVGVLGLPGKGAYQLLTTLPFALLLLSFVARQVETGRMKDATVAYPGFSESLLMPTFLPLLVMLLSRSLSIFK